MTVELTPSMAQSPCGANSHSVKKFPAFCGIWRFIAMFTRAHHLSPYWVRPIQSVPPHPTSRRSILILSFHACLVLPNDLLLLSFPTKTRYAPCPFSIHSTCPTHLILHDWITWIILGEQYRSFSSSFCSFLHSLVISSLLGPNSLLSPLFSSALGLHSSLSVSDQDTHPYKTTSKSIVLYILISTFLDSKLEDKRYCTRWWQAVSDYSLLIFFSWIEFRLIKIVPIYFIVHPFK
jgi:hypothetical protein